MYMYQFSNKTIKCMYYKYVLIHMGVSMDPVVTTDVN